MGRGARERGKEGVRAMTLIGKFIFVSEYLTQCMRRCGKGGREEEGKLEEGDLELAGSQGDMLSRVSSL